MIGIYRIINCKNKKCYVGSSINIEARWKQHIWLLKNKIHHSRGLQNAWNKYGKSEFSFEILEELENSSKLQEKEQKWIDRLNSYKKGYNGRTKADMHSSHDKKTLEKISKAASSAMKNPEIRKKIKISQTGSKNNLAKLDEGKVEEIKLELSHKLTNRRTLALKYNVSVDTIDDIISGLTWSHIKPDLIILKNKVNKLKKEEVELIRILCNNKIPQSKIAKMFKVCQQTISDINTGKLWSKL